MTNATLSPNDLERRRAAREGAELLALVGGDGAVLDEPQRYADPEEQHAGDDAGVRGGADVDLGHVVADRRRRREPDAAQTDRSDAS